MRTYTRWLRFISMLMGLAVLLAVSPAIAAKRKAPSAAAASHDSTSSVRHAKKSTRAPKAAAAAKKGAPAPAAGAYGAPSATPSAAAPSATPAPSAAAPAPATARPTVSSAPVAGSGMVWVNMETRIFHRAGTRWYGKTKNGQYMSEAEAVKAGCRPAKNE